MKKSRILLFLSLLSLGTLGLLAVLLEPGESQTSSFRTMYRILGKLPQSANRAISKGIPLKIDEAKLGETFKSEWRLYSNRFERQKERPHLQKLVDKISERKTKDLQYEIFISNDPNLNAFAYPGGAIVITRGLLNVLEDESELVSILAHEIGHIELSHGIDRLKQRIIIENAVPVFGDLIGYFKELMLDSSFSKTQEDESDEYGFQFLKSSEYDLQGMARAFEKLQAGSFNRDNAPNLILEYFETHPSLKERISKFKSRARKWERTHRKVRSRGKINFEKRIPLHELKLD